MTPEERYQVARAVWLYTRSCHARAFGEARKVEALLRRVTRWLTVAPRKQVAEYYRQIGQPTCSFGHPFPCGPCDDCLAETERLSQEFEAAVARGEYDAEGYTPNERKAQARRRTKAETEGT